MAFRIPSRRELAGFIFITLMVLFAAGSSSPPKKPQHEVLSEKYDISEDEAKYCITVFDKKAEPVVKWISEQDNFLGFGEKDCEDLEEEVDEIGSADLVVYALENNLDYDDEEFISYRENFEAEAKKAAELAAIKEAERKERKAKADAEAAKRRAERQRQDAIIAALGKGTVSYYGPNHRDNDIDVETAKLLCEKSYSVRRKAMITNLLGKDYKASRIATNGGSVIKERIFWFEGKQTCVVGYKVTGLYQGTNYSSSFVGTVGQFELSGGNPSILSLY